MNFRYLTISLIFVSFILLILGLTLPIFQLSIDSELSSQVANISSRVLDQKRSILGTVEHLFVTSRYLVAILIFLFSVLIPIIKGFMLLITLLKPSIKCKKKILSFVSLLAKWSMADVFVVSIFLAFLATSQAGSTYNTSVTVMGMNLPIKLNTLMTSKLGSGFFYFLAYCLLSIVTGILSKKADEQFTNV